MTNGGLTDFCAKILNLLTNKLINIANNSEK